MRELKEEWNDLASQKHQRELDERENEKNHFNNPTIEYGKSSMMTLSGEDLHRDDREL